MGLEERVRVTRVSVFIRTIVHSSSLALILFRFVCMYNFSSVRMYVVFNVVCRYECTRV